MKPARLNTIAPSILTLTLAATALPAQEVVELPGQDQRIEPDFEEVYRVGVLDGESWEMFGQVSQVAFDGQGNLYVFDGTSGLGGSGDLRILVFARPTSPACRCRGAFGRTREAEPSSPETSGGAWALPSESTAGARSPGPTDPSTC